MTTRGRSFFLIGAIAAMASLASSGCGSRTYGRGLRRLAPFGVRLGWFDFSDFELAEVEDRPQAGLYLRTSVKGRAMIELAADAALDMDAPDEEPLYAGSLSLLFFPTERGGVYLHAGGGALSASTTSYNYIDGFASAGVGYSLPAGPTRLDIRAGMWQMIKSTNITRAFVFTLGYGF